MVNDVCSSAARGVSSTGLTAIALRPGRIGARGRSKGCVGATALGLSRTFTILRNAPPHLAREIYLAALQEEHPDILETVALRLLEGGGEEAALLVLERFHVLPERLQERLLSNPRPFVRLVPQFAEHAGEAQRLTALRFIARAAEPAQAAVAARALLGSEATRLVAASYFDSVARELALLRAGSLNALAVTHDPPALRALHAALQQALEQYEHHRETPVLRCLLELEGDGHAALQGVLANADHPARADLCRLLEQTDTRAAANFLLHLTRLREAPLRAAAAEMMGNKQTAAFGRCVADYIFGLGDSERELISSRTTEIPWWPAVRAELPRFRPDERERMVEFLTTGGLAPEDLAPALRDLFEDASLTLRNRIVKIATRSRRPEMAPVLARALLEDNEAIQTAALEVLEEISPPDLVRMITPLLGSSFREVRHHASHILSHRSFKLYLDRFDQLDPATRQAAGRALSKIDVGMIDRVSDELQSMDPARRVKALHVLEILGKEKEVESQLYELFRDRDRKVRATVLKAIALLGTVESLQLLLQALSDPDRRIRANAVEAFEDLGNPRFREVLLPFLKDPDNRVRGNACRALWLLGCAEEVDAALRDMLQGPDELMRLSAVWALKELPHPSRNAWLRALAESDGSEKVRARAAEALLAPSAESD